MMNFEEREREGHIHSILLFIIKRTISSNIEKLIKNHF
jgi:hypothetical protein